MSTSTAASHGGVDGSLEKEAAARGLFVRRSSGLVRDIGLGGAFGLNLGFLSIGGALGYFAILFTLFPQGNILWVLVIGGLLTGLLAVVYSQLATTMPRSGGDYVYQSRVFHPVVGAWIGVGFAIYALYLIATSGAYFASSFLPYIFGTLGATLHVSALNTLANDVTTQTGTFIASMVMLAATIAFAAAGVKIAARAAYWFVVAGLVSVTVIILELLAHGSASFAHAFDHTSGHPGAYAAIIGEARAHGWKPGTTFSATLNEIPYAFLIFGGFWSTCYTGGEVKQPARTQQLAMGLAFAVGLVAIVLAWLTMEHAATANFIQAASFLQANAPATYAKLTSVASITPQAYAVVASGDPVTKVIMAVGWAGWLIPGYIMFVLALSRTMFALSFDRLIPVGVTRVSGRRHNPVVALTITAVGITALTALVIYDQGITGAFKNIIVLGAFIALMACLAAVALPYRRRQLYEASPKVLGRRWLGVPGNVWTSVVAGGFCGVVTYLTLTNGTYSGGYTTTSIITLLVMGVAGLVVYGLSRWIRGQQGIDISLAMRELPPD